MTLWDPGAYKAFEPIFERVISSVWLFDFAKEFPSFCSPSKRFSSAARVFPSSSWRLHDLLLAARPPKEAMPLGFLMLLVPMALGQVAPLCPPCRPALILLQVRRRNFCSFSVEGIRSLSLMVLWTFIPIFSVQSEKLSLSIDFLERDRGNFNFCFQIPVTV